MNSNKNNSEVNLTRMTRDSTKSTIMLMSQSLNKSKITCFTVRASVIDLLLSISRIGTQANSLRIESLCAPMDGTALILLGAFERIAADAATLAGPEGVLICMRRN